MLRFDPGIIQSSQINGFDEKLTNPQTALVGFIQYLQFELRDSPFIWNIRLSEKAKSNRSRVRFNPILRDGLNLNIEIDTFNAFFSFWLVRTEIQRTGGNIDWVPDPIVELTRSVVSELSNELLLKIDQEKIKLQVIHSDWLGGIADGSPLSAVLSNVLYEMMPQLEGYLKDGSWPDAINGLDSKLYNELAYRSDSEVRARNLNLLASIFYAQIPFWLHGLAVSKEINIGY